MARLFLGIDLGGTNIKIGLFDDKLTLIEKTSLPTQPEKGPEFVIENIAVAASDLLSKNSFSKEELLGASVGCPGPVDLKRGVIENAPNLPLFRGFAFRDALGRRLNIPVTMENDANAALWGEHALGSARGVKDVVLLTLGTGIGGAVIANGHIVHGHCDAAGELGHIAIFPNGRLCGCGQRGCAEAYASASSTAKRAIEEIQKGRESTLKELLEQNKTLSCRDVYAHRDSGDELACEVTSLTHEVLGRLCAVIQNFISPEKIIFSGGMIARGDDLLNDIRAEFEKYAWPGRQDSVEIYFASLGEESGIIGNAALAIEASRNIEN